MSSFSKAAAVVALAGLAATAQMAPNLAISSIPTVKAKKGSTATVAIHAVLPPGYHANSNTPTDAYLIPLTLKWSGGPLEADGVAYPKPTMEKYSFSDKPLSVVTGDFTVTAKFKVPENAPAGPAAENGTLRYQACNDRMCFPPKTVNVSVPLNIE